MLSRRSIATYAAGFVALAVAGCASTANTGGVSVPTIAQVQGWVNVLNTELPLFIQESINTGLLTGANQANALTALKTFQTLAAQVLSPTFSLSNATQVIGQLGLALTSVLAVIPATAPYVGFIELGVAVITGFIAATPMVVPAVPAPAKLASMHKDTITFRK